MTRPSHARLQPRQLAAVAAVARAGSVHAAARELGIPQPAVSRLIAATEKTLGATLFARSRAGTQLTDTGERVLKQIQFALRALENIPLAAQQPQLVVRLGCIPRVMHVLMPHLLSQISEHKADFTLRVSVGSSSELMAELEDARLDYVITLRGTPRASEGALEAENLYSERTVVVCSRDNPDLPELPCAIHRLAALPWVLPKPDFHSRQLIDRALAAAGQAPIVPVIETNSFETSLSVVAATRFLALAPEFAAKRFERLKLVRIVPTRPALGASPVMLQHPPEQASHPAHAAFRAAVIAAARKVQAA